MDITLKRNKRKTTEEFIQEAKLIHGQKYDYSKVEYVNANKNVKIICPLHGEFLQTPHSHLKGCGCTKCGRKKVGDKRRKTTDNFINDAKRIHGNSYDYSQTKYVNALQKVKIICPEHGEFWQTPNIHLKGSGCEKCCGRFVKDTNTFIEAAKKIHGNKYCYSKTNYISTNTKVCIVCPKHGEFWQTPRHHLSNEGCPICAIVTPKAENEILNAITPIYTEQHNRKILNGKEIDIYIPSHNIGIEFNGLYWHSEENGKTQNYHMDKIDECNLNGVGLFTIYEDEWINKRKLCEFNLNYALGNIKSQINKTQECAYREVKDKNYINDFLMRNTFLEKVSCSFAIGAFHGGNLITLLVVKRYKDKFIIKCIASNIKHTEYNFEDSLLNYFIKNYSFKELSSFVDKKWICNQFDNFYTKHGFKLIKSIPPKAMYYNRKIAPYKKFSEKEYLNKNPNDTNWIKVWDCGSIKYSLVK